MSGLDWGALMPESAKFDAPQGFQDDSGMNGSSSVTAATQQRFPSVSTVSAQGFHVFSNENNEVSKVSKVSTKKTVAGLSEGIIERENGPDKASGLCDSEVTKLNGNYRWHPSAVILLLAFCEQVGTTPEERIELLLDLRNYPPGEQVSRWHLSCVECGVLPWRVLSTVATMEGKDCTLCKHLKHQTYPEPNGRRLFHWGCGRGYLILECGHGTGRIWIAPPECGSWEKWQPSATT